MIDLRLGDWRDVLADQECDALICDPPYGARTHNVARPTGVIGGTRNGAYVVNRDPGHIGGKPRLLMNAIVRDYSRPGDLVCDPCAGGATTLLAAQALGRRAIGAEVDPDTHAKAMERIRRDAGQGDLFAGVGT